MPLHAVNGIQQRNQAQQHEAVPQQIAAEHVTRAHEEDVRRREHRHGADDRECLGERKQQPHRSCRPFVARRLLDVDRVEARNLCVLGVGGAHHANAGERLLEYGETAGD